VADRDNDDAAEADGDKDDGVNGANNDELYEEEEVTDRVGPRFQRDNADDGELRVPAEGVNSTTRRRIQFLVAQARLDPEFTFFLQIQSPRLGLLEDPTDLFRDKKRNGFVVNNWDSTVKEHLADLEPGMRLKKVSNDGRDVNSKNPQVKSRGDPDDLQKDGERRKSYGLFKIV
jgi:hypothetical protein